MKQKLLQVREAKKAVITAQMKKIEDVKRSDVDMVEFDTILEAVEAKFKSLEGSNEKILVQTDGEDLLTEMTETDDYMLSVKIQIRSLQAFKNNRKSSTPSIQAATTASSDFQPTGSSIQPTGSSFHPSEFRVQSAEGIRSTELYPTDVCPGEPFSNASVQSQNIATDRVQYTCQPVSNASINSTNSSIFHRLPKLTLPTFNGDILRWQTFWDSFESTIHLNYNLTDVQKFSYLQSQLESEAANTIEGFTLTNANYARAINLLKERYGRRQKITQVLLQLPAPTNSIHSLRSVYDKMESYIRSLESNGQYQDTYGNLLVPIILDKLPGEVRRNLAREHGDGDWQLLDPRKAISREINILDAGGPISHQPEVDMYGSTASFYTGTKTKRTAPVSSNPMIPPKRSHRNPVKCAFCQESHSSIDCAKYPDVASRLAVVKKNRLCFNCLGSHMMSRCKSRRTCQKCHKKHHTSICQPEKTPQPSIPTQTQTSDPKAPAQAFYPQPEVTMHASSTQKSLSGVLLKTAIAPICSRENHSLDATILFDEGSQRSYITQSLAQELQLARETTETICLSAFGGKSDGVQHLDTTTVYLITDSKQKIPIKTIIVPTIANPITNHLKDSTVNLPYLRGLKLAHPVSSDSCFNISLLIGADFYWDIVEDEVRRGDGQ
ncbi:uncharacterized protein LOC128552105 [Mercenaria mercenaria]|uniref:uncharacterized protein LOC128552105 n=1 Tax=Mercenaria mercenaria TaxID=6596 RepID=UPI00234F756A|nr:uncharacterized protein LOC128552105 [Mercenaria mercenaria]